MVLFSKTVHIKFYIFFSIDEILHLFIFYYIFNFIKEMFEIQAKEKGIEFKVSISDDVPDYFKTDPARLRQILMNLASNALKFTSDGAINLMVNVWNNSYLEKDLDIQLQIDCSKDINSEIEIDSLMEKI